MRLKQDREQGIDAQRIQALEMALEALTAEREREAARASHAEGRLEVGVAALQAQYRAQGQSAGMRMLRQIMVRGVKGEVALRLVLWRTAIEDSNRPVGSHTETPHP